MQGIMCFSSVNDALRAGYEILRPAYPDHDGLLQARTMTTSGWAIAFVKVKV
jgi:hypothetical protein